MKRERDEPVAFLSVVTGVLWVCTAAVGLSGLLRGDPPPPATQPATPPTQLLNVELEEPPALPAPTDPTRTAVAPVVASVAPPLMPAIAPAADGPAAFPLPMATPAVVTGRQTAARAPVVRQLTFGQGEGRQPPPVYPPEAVGDQQQGVVIVRFLVDSAGTVETAQASAPCPWPLLNDAAVRAVRDTWHFFPGPPRSFEVAIRFQLQSL